MSVDSSNYPFLARALSRNMNLSDMIDDAYGERESYLAYLDELFKDLFENSCVNIEEKISDIDSLNKFDSVIAEFLIARHLLKVGYSIEFLPDNQSAKKSPDIRLKKNGKEILIEVTKIGDGPVVDTILNHLRDFLKGRPYRVDIELDVELSLPTTDHVEFKNAENELLTSLKEFESKFRNSTSEYSIETAHVKFKVCPIERSDGYPGIISHACIGVPTDKILRYMASRAELKANKYKDFSPSDKAIPYVVAICTSLPYLDSILLRELVYGTTRGYGPINEHNKAWIENDFQQQIEFYKSSPEWKRIEEASSKGWKGFLENLYLIPNDYAYVSEHGLFLKEESMDNVVGLILLTPGDRIAFFPNPFSDYNLTFDEIIELIKMIDTMFR